MAGRRPCWELNVKFRFVVVICVLNHRLDVESQWHAKYSQGMEIISAPGKHICFAVEGIGEDRYLVTFGNG
jgi:hypothetical protein